MAEHIGGRPISLWLATAGQTGYPSLAGDVEVDVAVIGGGVAGLTAALALKRGGLTVAVLEASRVGTGVTGHTTGKVTSLHRLAYAELAERHGASTARSYGEANQAALEHIARTVSEENIDCSFRRVSNYTYAESQDAADLVRTEADLAARLGLPCSFTTDVPLPFPVRAAVRFDGQAQLHALKYLQGLAAAVDGDGSFVFEASRVSGLRDGAPGVVDTERGSVRAHDIIVATNVPFGDQGSFETRCYPHRSYIVASRAQLPAMDATFISADEPLRSILTIDVEGTSYVLTGGEGHRVTDGGDSADRYARLAAFSRDRLGAGNAEFRWSTQDIMTVDGLPYVGLMSSGGKHVHVITGLRKWGLTNGTAAALILADTLSGRRNPWAAVFDSNRPTPQGAEIPALLRETKPQAAGKPAPGLPAPGEGTVVDADGEPVAVYAHPDGKLQAVSAVCTHLGCTVGFNAEDATWDCPCHGSRFATDGTVIQGPATANLQSKLLPGSVKTGT
jgi:glycine/D-amino acid oxidase-like deaminating enzyme/nitrite reductase/ring-hydroxylating ferredoxin subunit